MSPKPALPPFISYFNVAPPPRSWAQRHYQAPLTPRSSGQVATRCHHPDCGDEREGHLLSIDVTFALASLKAWAHSNAHALTDKAS